MFKAHQFQPLNTFFEITLGSLNNIYQTPDIPIEFEINFKAGGGFGEWRMQLFDNSGFEVEPYIYEAFLNSSKGSYASIGLRWGYTAQIHYEAEFVKGSIIQYHNSVERNSFVITLNGTVADATPLSASNQYTGTALEVLNTYAVLHDYILIIDPPPDVELMMNVDETNGKTTEYREAVLTKQGHETDFRFIDRVVNTLIAPGGKSPYIAYYTNINGQNILEVKMPEVTAVEYTYIVQDRDSVVVEWRPEIDFLIGAATNGGEYRTNAQQFFTGDEQKFTMDPQLSYPHLPVIDPANAYTVLMRGYPIQQPPTVEKHFVSEIIEDQVKSHGLRIRPRPTARPTSEFNKELNEFARQRLKTLKAELTIEGDPTIRPGRRCEVLFYYPTDMELPQTGNSRLHYTSGIYWVTEVLHKISGGSYLTTLSLYRHSFNEIPIFIGLGPGTQG